MRCVRQCFPVIFLLFCCLILVVLPKHSPAGTGGSPLTIPIPREFKPALKADGSLLYTSIADIQSTFRRFSPDLEKFVYNRLLSDIPLIVPDSQWMKDLLVTYNTFTNREGIRAEADTWDCENFSSMLSSITTVSVWRAGYFDTRAAVGWLKVNGKHGWAGIPSGIHALMFTVIDSGIFIIEPQNGKYIQLADYPNYRDIMEVYLY
jgi:hypothetical protein